MQDLYLLQLLCENSYLYFLDKKLQQLVQLLENHIY